MAVDPAIVSTPIPPPILTTVSRIRPVTNSSPSSLLVFVHCFHCVRRAARPSVLFAQLLRPYTHPSGLPETRCASLSPCSRGGRLVPACTFKTWYALSLPRPLQHHLFCPGPSDEGPPVPRLCRAEHRAARHHAVRLSVTAALPPMSPALSIVSWTGRWLLLCCRSCFWDRQRALCFHTLPLRDLPCFFRLWAHIPAHPLTAGLAVESHGAHQRRALKIRRFRAWALPSPPRA